MSGQLAKQLFGSFDSFKAEQEANAIVQLTFEQLGLPELHKFTKIEFSNRFQNKAGDAILKQGYKWDGVTKTGGFHHYEGKIRLSSKYFAVVSEEEKLETVVHEACHIANNYLKYTNVDWKLNVYNYQQEKQTEGHGPGWTRLMKQVGYADANRYHCTNTTQFKNYYRWICSKCGKNGLITAQLGGRMIKNGQVRLCTDKECRGRVLPNDLKKVSGADLVYVDGVIKGK